MSQSQTVGAELERAVEAIEHTILKSCPAYSERKFSIERRKIVVVDGVKHEFDLWVEIDLGSGYTSTFVFECKNWRAKVNKNEIIVFSKKLEVAKAQKGFFVAATFTRDAEAMAAQDRRLELVTASRMEPQLEVLEHFHFVGINPVNPEISVSGRSQSQQGDDVIQLAGAKAMLQGEPIDLPAYSKAWIDNVTSRHSGKFPSHKMPSGVYPIPVEDDRTFGPGELVVDGIEILTAHLKVTLEIHIVWPKIVSSYDVQSRGRVMFLEPIKLPFVEMEMMTIAVEATA
jgi:hypothetical protein